MPTLRIKLGNRLVGTITDRDKLERELDAVRRARSKQIRACWSGEGRGIRFLSLVRNQSATYDVLPPIAIRSWCGYR